MYKQTKIPPPSPQTQSFILVTRWETEDVLCDRRRCGTNNDELSYNCYKYAKFIIFEHINILFQNFESLK